MTITPQQQGREYENYAHTRLIELYNANDVLKEKDIAKKYNKIKKFDFLIRYSEESYILIQCKHYTGKLGENEVFAIIKKYEDIIVEFELDDDINRYNCHVIIDCNSGLTYPALEQVKKYNSTLRHLYNISEYPEYDFIHVTEPINIKDYSLQFEKLEQSLEEVYEHINDESICEMLNTRNINISDSDDYEDDVEKMYNKLYINSRTIVNYIDKFKQLKVDKNRNDIELQNYKNIMNNTLECKTRSYDQLYKRYLCKCNDFDNLNINYQKIEANYEISLEIYMLQRKEIEELNDKLKEQDTWYNRIYKYITSK